MSQPLMGARVYGPFRRVVRSIGLTAIFATAVSTASAATVTASWDANTDGTTVGYRLSYGTVSGVYATTVDAGNHTSVPLTLTTGTYYFVVRAYDASGMLGPGSNEASIVISDPVPAPTAQITATVGTGGVTTLAWATTNAASATINGTAVALSGTSQVTITATTTFSLVAVGAGGTTTASATATYAPVDCLMSEWSFQSATAWSTCTGGQQSRTETWVRSVITPPSGGGAACGPTSELRVVSQTCTSPTIAVPGAPSRVKSIVSGSTVTLYWSRPTSGGPADGYQISVGTSSGASDIINRRDVGAVTSATGTLANGQYYARVYAYNSAGVGPASSDIWFKVGARRRPGSPSGITASFQNSTVVLGWAPPAGDPEDAPTGYAIEVGSAPGRYDLAAIPTRDVTSFQAVAPPGIYFVRVRAANDLGGGGASQEIVVRAGSGPGAPTSLSALRQGALVELRWQAPSTGATLPGSYIVEVGTAPGLADRAVLRVANETRFATVAPAGVYYVRVRAVGADGVAGESSNEIVVTQ